MCPLTRKHYSAVTWVCHGCGSRQSRAEVALSSKILDSTWNSLLKCAASPLRKQMLMLDKLKPNFGDQHYYVMEVKRRIIELIGGKDHPYDKVEEDLLKLKVQYCEDHLDLISVLSPGLSESSGWMSLHLAEALVCCVERGLDNIQEKKTIIEDNLERVVQIFGPYRTDSYEREKAEHAKVLMKKVAKLILKQKM